MLTANPVLSGKPPPVEGDSGMAFRLSHFFPALPSCSSLTQLAFSTGFKTRARKPDSHPKQSFRWGCSLRLSLNLSPFSTPGLYTGNWNAKQGVCEWREALSIWAAASSAQVGQVHSVRLNSNEASCFLLPSTPKLFIQTHYLISEMTMFKKICEHFKRLSLKKKQSKICFI